jgi:transcription elongation factor B subunit 1
MALTNPTMEIAEPSSLAATSDMASSSSAMEDDKDETPYVKLISAEGSEIYLARRIAVQVETLRVMLEGNFRESEEGVIRFPDIGTSALEKVVKYLHYKDRYSNSPSRIPEFVIDPEEVRYRFVIIFELYWASSCSFFILEYHRALFM